MVCPSISTPVIQNKMAIICAIRNCDFKYVLQTIAKPNKNIAELLDLRCRFSNSCALEWCVVMAKIHIHNESSVKQFLHIGTIIFRHMLQYRKYTSLRTRNYKGMTFLTTLLDTYMDIHTPSTSKLFLTFIHNLYKYADHKHISSHVFALGIYWNTPKRERKHYPVLDTKAILFKCIRYARKRHL